MRDQTAALVVSILDAGPVWRRGPWSDWATATIRALLEEVQRLDAEVVRLQAAAVDTNEMKGSIS